MSVEAMQSIEMDEENSASQTAVSYTHLTLPTKA